jgi:hypothetical protein
MPASMPLWRSRKPLSPWSLELPWLSRFGHGRGRPYPSGSDAAALGLRTGTSLTIDYSSIIRLAERFGFQIQDERKCIRSKLFKERLL